jgi:protein-S-isoprenylcysteine O-methyltransferase Ste14
MRFSALMPALTTLAVWFVVGMVYLWDIRLYSSRTYLRRMPNYRHFSHALIACQITGMLTGAGQLSPGKPFAWIASWLGFLLGVGGFILCLWAKKTLGPFWDRHASIQVDHRLVRTGPYAWCRNPIFLGQFGLFVGAGLASLNGVALICCAPALWSFYRRLHTEEILLAEHFGQEYESYRSDVSCLWPVPTRLQPRSATMSVPSELLKTSE